MLAALIAEKRRRCRIADSGETSWGRYRTFFPVVFAAARRTVQVLLMHVVQEGRTHMSWRLTTNSQAMSNSWWQVLERFGIWRGLRLRAPSHFIVHGPACYP